jgi:O-acetylhomoserine/O-acetylserine sulfhydrylase-like pyridoxal-dependent enzyme
MKYKKVEIMSSKNFATNALYAEHNIAKQIASLFGATRTAKEIADGIRFSFESNTGDSKSKIIHPASIKRQRLCVEEHVVTGIAKDSILLSVRQKKRQDLKVCCLSEVFIELKA